MSKSKAPTVGKRNSLRTHRHIFTLNDEEEKALNRYFAKYNVRNKSKFIREAVIGIVLKRFEDDHPRLFD